MGNFLAKRESHFDSIGYLCDCFVLFQAAIVARLSYLMIVWGIASDTGEMDEIFV